MKTKINPRTLLLIAFELSLSVILFWRLPRIIGRINFTTDKVVLRLEALSKHDNIFQIYYAMSNTFEENKSLKVETEGSSEKQNIDFVLPADFKGDQLRIDLGNLPDTIKIFRMLIIGPNNTYVWTPEQFRREFRPANQVSYYELGTDCLNVLSTGNDPFVQNNISTYYLFDSFMSDRKDRSKPVFYSFVFSLLFLGVLHFVLFGAMKPKDQQ